MKDLFSSHSADYAMFRPGYPPVLFEYLRGITATKERAWDCATGTGQVAGELASFFEQVYATDISLNQLSQAIQKSNIHYTKQRAESTGFPDDYFDLLTVGQAIHWFNLEDFYAEAKRVLKKDAVIAVFGYALFKSNPETDKIIQNFYEKIIGPYWEPERRFIEEKYQSIPFPFREISTPQFELEQQWSLERLIGYLNTWSAVKSYEKETSSNPVKLIQKDLLETFGDLGKLKFPIILRVGKTDKTGAIG